MDLNGVIERIIMLHDKGGNPQQIMQQLFGNTNINQLGMQMQNMSKGMTRPQFYLQIAKQNGISEKNLEGMARIFGVNK